MIITEEFFIKHMDDINNGKVALQDDGEGRYIKVWDESLGDYPTQEYINSLVNDTYVIEHKKKVINEEIYKKLDGVDLKSIRALRTGDTSRLESLEQEAIALRAQLVK